MKTLLTLALAVSPARVVVGKPDFASQTVVSLEERYIQDCETNPSPHGFYGAFLEPCEFSFFQGELDATDPCSGEPMATPVPLNWAINLTDHYKNQDWDKFSSKDIPDPEADLLFWPDQCVGATPRCYSIADHALILSKLFPEGGVPQEATHVRVDCRVDALALSRTIRAFADGFETTMTTMILWSATLLVLLVCSTMWCIYLCFRLCSGGRGNYRNVPQNARYVLSAQDIKGNYQTVYIDTPDYAETEMSKHAF